jgi:hypothetical protein
MIQNLVLNNSDHNFSVISAQLQAATDTPQVNPTPGTDAAVVKSLRAQLESGALTQSGQGINANFSA